MSESEADDWRELAECLQERGGVPDRRSQVVALIATGRTHSEAQDELGLENRSTGALHVKAYREQDLPEANWLSENGPEI